ncbi:MAG: hypothetical protein KGS72_24935 [Cyanobacteria bacterium REEB67]|nr:hypothetical protein [Cyanobacteria bacterium REEB67]
MRLLSLLQEGRWNKPNDDRARELWPRIKAYELDKPNVPFPFSARLMKEQGWSAALAQAAIEEYKRFMFLAVAAGHRVTPSKTVDEVWHLHLIYTREYWEEFCVKVLDRIIHHDPGNGETGEQRAFDDLYQRTLESYMRFFGTVPPKAIWGSRNGELNVRRTAPETPAILPDNGNCAAEAVS